LAWQTFRFSTTRPDIIYQTLTNGTWGSIGRLTFTGYNTSPALAQQNGAVTLFWSQQNTKTFTIYYETLVSPTTWSSSRNATTISTAYNDTAPAATVSVDGTLWLFWQRTNESCTSSCIQTKQIYYKTLINGSWSTETQITKDRNWNSSPSAVIAEDHTVRLAWAKYGQSAGSTVTSSIINYMTYNGTTWSPPKNITSTPSGFSDQHPSIIQDRNGTIWLFWSRTSLTAPQFVLYGKFSYNNGQDLSTRPETILNSELSGIDDQQPVAVQGNSRNDKTIHVFYSSDRTNFRYDIWSITSNPIAPIHDIGITAVYNNNPWWYSGGMTDIGENSNYTFSFTVVNYGDYGENVQATASVSNKTSIGLGTQTQPLGLGSSWTFFFSWNTTNPNVTNVPAGRYNIIVNLVSNGTETTGNLGDNSVTVKNGIRLLPWGDMDQDGNVNLQDVSVFVYDFGFTPATPSRWCAVCDITGNNVIDLLDVSIAVKNFGIIS
jgi:hypothetical protein